VPEVEHFNLKGGLVNPVVNQNASVNNLAKTWARRMGAAHAGKAAQQVYMIQESSPEASRSSRIVDRDPIEQILQIR
jgi:hypothetical protein